MNDAMVSRDASLTFSATEYCGVQNDGDNIIVCNGSDVSKKSKAVTVAGSR